MNRSGYHLSFSCLHWSFNGYPLSFSGPVFFSQSKLKFYSSMSFSKKSSAADLRYLNEAQNEICHKWNFIPPWKKITFTLFSIANKMKWNFVSDWSEWNGPLITANHAFFIYENIQMFLFLFLERSTFWFGVTFLVFVLF